jgi:hypothetical protein
MSLPSGLIFFLDFTFSGNRADGADDAFRLGEIADTSLYGGGRVGSEITGGIDLSTAPNPEVGPYALNNGYSSPTGSNTVASGSFTRIASGTVGTNEDRLAVDGVTTLGSLYQFDADLASGSDVVAVYEVGLSDIQATGEDLNLDDLITVQVSSSTGVGLFGTGARLLRRLTQFSSASAGGKIGDRSSDSVLFVVQGSSLVTLTASVETANHAMSYAQTDEFDNGGALGSVLGQTDWGLENEARIPEIDIKVDSVARPSGHQSWVKTSTLTTTLTPRLSLHRSSLSRLLLRSIARSLRILYVALQLVYVTGPATQVSSLTARQVLCLL